MAETSVGEPGLFRGIGAGKPFWREPESESMKNLKGAGAIIATTKIRNNYVAI